MNDLLINSCVEDVEVILLVVMVSTTVACGGRKRAPKLRSSSCSCRKRRRGPRLKVCLGFWYRGEVNGDDEVVFRVAEGLPTVERERTGLCNLERERETKPERERVVLLTKKMTVFSSDLGVFLMPKINVICLESLPFFSTFSSQFFSVFFVSSFPPCSVHDCLLQKNLACYGGRLVGDVVAGVPATVAGWQAWVAGQWAAGKGGMACR